VDQTAPEKEGGVSSLAIQPVRDLASPRRIAFAAIGLGVLAFWVTLPPAHARTIGLPIGLGIAGVAAGLWAARLGVRDGDEVLLRIERPDLMPWEMPFSARGSSGPLGSSGLGGSASLSRQYAQSRLPSGPARSRSCQAE
jgi:hypothetical protein